MMAWANLSLLPKKHPLLPSLVVSNVLLTTFLAILSALATMISDGSIQGELALSEPKAVWLTTLYLLGVNTTVPTSSWFVNRYGTKIIYTLGVVLFSFSSALSALAPNFATIGIARALEGVGAGLLLPAGLTTIVQTVSPKALPFSLSLYGANFGVSFAIGLPLSGYLTQFLSWRLIFLLIFALGTLGAIVCWLVHENSEKQKDSKFDIWGFFSFATFIASLLVALTYGPLRSTDEGWRSPLVLALFTLAGLCLLATLWIERSHPNPIIPLQLFQNPIFSVAAIAMFLLGMSIFASISTMMKYMIDALGYEKYVSGKIGIIYGTSFLLFGMIGNALIKKIPVSVLTFTGLTLLIYSYFLNNELDWMSGPDQIFWILLLRGIGLGLSLGPTTIQAMQNVPKELSAKGATLLTFFRQVGGTYGGTLISIIVIKRQIFHAARFAEQTNAQLPAYQVTVHKIFNQFYHNTSEGLLQSTAQAKEVIANNLLTQSFILAINDAMRIFGVVTAVVAIALLLLNGVEWWKRKRLSRLRGSAP